MFHNNTHTLQGCAVVLPTYAPGTDLTKLPLSPTASKGQPIRHLVSAPTMRIPSNVDKTANAYLAFRAVLRAGGSASEEKNVYACMQASNNLPPYLHTVYIHMRICWD